MRQPADRPRFPLRVELAYTAFVAVLVPYYWRVYGPTNFLYFCDVALLVAPAALRRKDPLWWAFPCGRSGQSVS